MENQVSNDVAQEEFDRFLDRNRLIWDIDDNDAEDRKDMIEYRDRFIREIEAGNLTIDDNGLPSYTCVYKEDCTFKFNRPTGATYAQMDKKKDSAKMAKLFVAIAEMTKRSPKVISTLDNYDLRVLIAIFSIFFTCK